MKNLRIAIIFIVVLCSMNVGCREEVVNPPTVTIENVDNSVTVGIKTKDNAYRNRTTNFMRNGSVITTERNGVLFEGFLVSGDGEKVKVLAALETDGSGFLVEIDSSLPLILKGKLTHPDGSVNTIIKPVEAGTLSIKLRPEIQ